tara:strand:- start:68 stop:538 length:471 start_codon:yes stop_codon:yes gene_type:complete
MQIATDKCLDEIEGVDWGEPDYDSHLVVTCHELRKKPIAEFTAEDLRIMIGQDISSEILLPIALNRLSEDPLISGDLYDGDLLSVVSRLPSTYWSKHRDQHEELLRIAEVAIERLRSDEEPDRQLMAELKAVVSKPNEGEQVVADQRTARREQKSP